MTLPLPWDFRAEKNTDPDRLQDVIDRIALQFPVTAANMVGAVQGTTLPTSPVNGQDYYYVADATNGVVWHLKYRSASASSYKWELVGGPPLVSSVIADEQLATGTATYQNLTTDGPSITVPLAGDYDWEAGVEGYQAGGTTTTLRAGLSVAGSTPSSPGFVDLLTVSGGAPQAFNANRITGVAASSVVKLQYLRQTGLTQNWRYRVLRVRPVRVG